MLQAALEEAKATAQTTEASTFTPSQDQSSNSTQYEHDVAGLDNHVTCGPDTSASSVEEQSKDIAATVQEIMKQNVSPTNHNAAIVSLSL